MDVNAQGTIAVADKAANVVELFAPAATGDAAPSATITGGATRLDAPAFVAFTPPPAVVTGPARHVTRYGATLTGTVIADGSRTHWWFRYRPVASTAWSAARVQSIRGGSARHQVRSRITGLKAATTYRYQLLASNPGGRAFGASRVLATRRHRRLFCSRPTSYLTHCTSAARSLDR
jgi:hypothetical protein